jgi:hypothetical protein
MRDREEIARSADLCGSISTPILSQALRVRMTKRINVNPDHYKLAGRERPGHGVAKAPKVLAGDEAARARWEERQTRKIRGKGGK